MTIKSKVTQKTLKAIERLTGTSLTLGKLLGAIRESEDMTQAEFGAKLGISKQQLSDIEHDRKTVSPKLAVLYARRLGYSKEQFLRLSLQGVVDREGFDFTVEIKPKHKHTTFFKLSPHMAINPIQKKYVRRA